MGKVLLVHTSSELRRRMVQWLRQAGIDAESVATFEEARQRLTARSPDLLVTGAQLGEFNGLHLVIVGQSLRPTLASIVMGAPDAVLEKEVERQGATYMTEPVTEEGLVAQATVLLPDTGPRRRWPRRYVADRVNVEVGASAARILDVSYGGLRLEATEDEARAPSPGSQLHVSLPAYGVSVDAALVWVGRSPSGLLWYGAALADTNPNATTAWRDVVDRIGFRVQ